MTAALTTSTTKVTDIADARAQRLHGAVDPVVDTSDDPTGAVLVWPLAMLVLYALIALGVFIVL